MRVYKFKAMTTATAMMKMLLDESLEVIVDRDWQFFI
jgi:hypothetical protein